MSSQSADSKPQPQAEDAVDPAAPVAQRPEPASRRTGRPDPTRYGDWEKDGRCIDF